MKKLVVRGKDISCCIDCDFFELATKSNDKERIVVAYQGPSIVGIFNLDDISAMYLSEKKDG